MNGSEADDTNHHDHGNHIRISVEESGNPPTEPHIRVLLEEEVHFVQLRDDSRSSYLSRYFPTGVFYPIYSVSDQHLAFPTCNEFISLRRPNNIIHYANYIQQPQDIIDRRLLEEGSVAFGDLAVSLLSSYDSGSLSDPRDEETSLGGQQLTDQPEIDLNQGCEASVLGNLALSEVYAEGAHGLLHGDGLLDVNRDRCRDVQETQRKCICQINELRDADSPSGEEDDRIMETAQDSTASLPVEQIETEKNGVPGPVSTSGYETAPLTAEGNAPLQQEQLESLQTVPKQDKKEPVVHSSLPSEMQPATQPLAESLHVPPSRGLVQQLSATAQRDLQSQEQVENEVVSEEEDGNELDED